MLLFCLDSYYATLLLGFMLGYSLDRVHAKLHSCSGSASYSLARVHAKLLSCSGSC